MGGIRKPIRAQRYFKMPGESGRSRICKYQFDLITGEEMVQRGYFVITGILSTEIEIAGYDEPRVALYVSVRSTTVTSSVSCLILDSSSEIPEGYQFVGTIRKPFETSYLVYHVFAKYDNSNFEKEKKRWYEMQDEALRKAEEEKQQRK